MISAPFEITSRITISLDGSEEAAGIQGAYSTTNRLVYIGPDAWRVRRETPVTRNIHEYMRNQQGIYSISPKNEKIVPQFPPSERVWQQVVRTPYLLARQWSLPQSDLELGPWLKRVQTLSAEPLKNIEGDELSIVVEKKDDVEATTITASGMLMQNQTKVKVTLHWVIKRGLGLKLDLESSLLGEG